MSAICSNPMVRGLAVLFCAFVLGCGDDEDGGGGGAPGCSAGFERADDGSCVLASGGCAANQLRSLRSGQCLGAGWASCPEGFDANADGTSCEPVLTTSCAAGTRPVLGASSCAPVGFSDCPAGFTAAPWGCVDVLPEAPCTGATRDAIGSEICLPVGDCNAAFPPPDATAFVDDSFTAGELDATHFLTVGEAVAAASPSAVIAVESGTYAETLYVDRAISLVGRCPAEVVLQGNAVDAGIEVDGASGALVRGFSIRGHHRGVIVRGAGSLELIDSIVEDNDNEGILSTEASTLTVRGSVVRGSQPVDGSQFGFGVELNAGSSVELVATAVVDNHKFAVQLTDASTSLSMTDSVIRATRRDATGDFGLAMLIRSGASATISESVIAENYESGIVALGSGSNLTVSRSVLRDTLANITGHGRGIDVETGAHASLTDVTFLRHREAAVLSTGTGTEVSLERVTIEDTRPDAAGEHGTAVVAHEGGSVLVTDSALIRSGDQAIQVDHPGTVAIVERSIAAITGEDEGTFGRGLSAFGGRT